MAEALRKHGIWRNCGSPWNLAMRFGCGVRTSAVTRS